jgi:hypothetical protein
MNKKWIAVLCLLASALLTGQAFAAATISETEPNNTPAAANVLTGWDILTGAINPAGDVDYFSLDGKNTTWGFIALLDTTGSTAGQDGTLTALGSDGVTILQTDTGSWERGAGIALQNYANGSATHYLRVNEQGDNSPLDAYQLRFYNTVTATQPEVEPNETRLTGTPSAFTHAGVISADGDVDCFAFHGRAGDDFIFALNGDPEKNGSPADLSLKLYSPSDVELASANHSATGGSEFIEFTDLSVEGIYAYCVQRAAGLGGAAATYTAGLVRNGGLYYPQYELAAAWLDPPASGMAHVGDTLTFELSITNSSPLVIPGDIRISSDYAASCLSLVSTNPAYTSISDGHVSWDGQKNGLAVGEKYSVSMTLAALAPCSDSIYQGTGVTYYFTGHGNNAAYVIAHQVFLPLILQAP